MEVIVFCGIQASGKTTFFKDRFFKTHMRISLDQLKTRSREAKFLEICIKTRQPFVVDNTNPRKADREKYISMAKEKKFKVIGYFFQSKTDDAFIRNCQRPGKEYIPEPVIMATFNKFEIPTISEGFDELYVVEIDGDSFSIINWTDEI